MTSPTLKNLFYCCNNARPLLALNGELFSARGSQRVGAPAPSAFPGTPLARDPSLLLEPVEGWEQRAWPDRESAAGDLPDTVGNGDSVQGLELQSSKNQQIEGASEHFGLSAHCCHNIER
jgi:hypothetical protein